MREDMFKVIVERPRWGSRHAARSKLRYDKVPDRKHATGRRMVLESEGWTKCLNENLAPLKRYLSKQVGRPWDKVYSEICEHLDTSSTEIGKSTRLNSSHPSRSRMPSSA